MYSHAARLYGVLSVLGPHLNDGPVFRRGLDRFTTLEDVVRGRLLDIDMLLRLTRLDGRERMPVIGRGDDDGVHVFPVEELGDLLQPRRAADCREPIRLQAAASRPSCRSQI